MQILFYTFVAFIGYTLGRIGHVYWGYLKTPHHWIYGAILIILSLFFYDSYLSPFAFYFGTGHFISDFKDFLSLKILGPDKEGKKKFWGID